MFRVKNNEIINLEKLLSKGDVMIKTKILLTLLLSYSVASFAADVNVDLDTLKQKITTKADQRIAHIESFKSCVQASTTDDAVKACRKANKKKMKAFKASKSK